MSNNLDDVGESYSWLKKINLQKFDDKSFLIIGAGWMGKQYAKALHEMNVNDVTIISKNDEKATLLGKEFGYTAIGGGYETEILNEPRKEMWAAISKEREWESSNNFKSRRCTV